MIRAERQALRDMLTNVALDEYKNGGYVYSIEQRTAAAAALLRDYAHETTEMTQELADALESCLRGDVGE